MSDPKIRPHEPNILSVKAGAINGAAVPAVTIIKAVAPANIPAPVLTLILHA
jgi:hypothetical protein